MAEAVSIYDSPSGNDQNSAVMLGGYAALAESAWMGSVQATEVLEPLNAAPSTLLGRVRIPRIPKISLAGLFTREFSVPEASFILMASFFLSALLGAIRQVLFNAQFGVGMQANAYYAAFRLPDTLFSLIAGGALSSAMIPVLLSTYRENGAEAGHRLINLVLTTLLLVFAGVVLAGELFTPFFVQRLLAPGFDPQTSQLTIQLTRIMLAQPLILVFGSVATAVLNSRNQFFPTALSIAAHNISLIAGILAIRIYPPLGILGPTLGVVGGAVLQILILLPGLAGRGNHFQLVWNWRNPRLGEIVRLLIPNGLSVGINYSGFIVDTAFASQAAEIAGLPALYNAFLLVGLPIALLGQAIGQAAFPRLAARASEGDWVKMRRSLLLSLASAIALAIPALLALIFLGRPVIHILFERGKFGAAAGDLTYQVLIVYALALPAYVATELLTRGLIALRDTRTPLVTNAAQLAGRAALMALLIPQIGVIAVPAAFALTAAVETIAQAAVLLVKLQRQIAFSGKLGVLQ